MISYNPSPKHEEYLRKKRNWKIFKYSALVFLVLFIIGLISYLLYRPAVRVTEIDFSGETVLSPEEIKSVSAGYMEGSYFLLVPRNSIFFYPKKSLENFLLETYTRIETIDIGFKNFHSIKIQITERKPEYLWCLEADEVCYFMDNEGLLFDVAPDFSGDAYFKFYGLLEGDNLLGSYYIATSTNFSELKSFIDNVKGLSLEPTKLLGKGKNEYHMTLSNGSYIYFDTNKSLPDVYENLKALLSSPELSAADRRDLPVEYVDLRFGNKLFYKLKN